MCNAFRRSTDAVDLSREEESDDRPLLAALARGEQEAFWTLWLRHADKLFAVCLREMQGNRADAEDAQGQAMMRAHQKLPKFASYVDTERVAPSNVHDCVWPHPGFPRSR